MATYDGATSDDVPIDAAAVDTFNPLTCFDTVDGGGCLDTLNVNHAGLRSTIGSRLTITSNGLGFSGELQCARQRSR